MVETTTAIETAKAFINECIKKGVAVSEAWLFGSFVKGRAHRYSDIDLALVSEQFTLNFLENNKKTALLNYKYADIEVHHFSPDEFERDTPFVNEIKRTGIKIF
jgi:predicted nucleotidyltransferase